MGEAAFSARDHGVRSGERAPLLHAPTRQPAPPETRPPLSHPSRCHLRPPPVHRVPQLPVHPLVLVDLSQVGAQAGARRAGRASPGRIRMDVAGRLCCVAHLAHLEIVKCGFDGVGAGRGDLSLLLAFLLLREGSCLPLVPVR